MSKIQFTATLESLGDHHVTVIYIPEEIMDTKPKFRVRAEGVMNGVTFNLAVQSQKLGFKYFLVSKDLRKKIIANGQTNIVVIFEWVDADKLDIPEELEAVLNQDDDFKSKFDSFTVGKQRGLVHYITSAKTVDTRIKRSLELAWKVKNNALYSDKN